MNPPSADLVIEHAAQLLTCTASARATDAVGLIADGSVAITGDRITAAGPAAEVAATVDATRAQTIDSRGNVVMPGFVYSHTHLVFGGTRVDEYAAKLTGGDLSALRAKGVPVGITGTVDETSHLSIDALVEQALPRLRQMLLAGTTTVESKSGYGLTPASELRLLQANRVLDELQPATVVSTFLGAHAFPPDEAHERYVESTIAEMIPRVAEMHLAQFCDVYCDEGYFTPEQSRRILGAGVEYGLRPKIHLDQYSHTGAAELAAELHCVSADHLNFTEPAEASMLAAAGVVGVPTPGLDFAVAHHRPVNIRALIDAGMTIALATDCCPGCWLTDMQFVIVLACRLHRLSVAEAIRAATTGSAQALAMETEIGSLEPGKRADLLILDTERYENLAYHLAVNPVSTVIKAGKIVVTEGRLVA
jgi:imidazolonepropionase